MLSNKSMTLYTSLTCFLLAALIVILYSQFFTAPNKVAESAQSESTSLPMSMQSATQDVSTVAPSSSLSSVVPILIFTIFYSIFRAGFLLKNGGPNTEWLVIAFTLIFSIMLYLEYKTETNKIFSNSW